MRSINAMPIGSLKIFFASKIDYFFFLNFAYNFHHNCGGNFEGVIKKKTETLGFVAWLSVLPSYLRRQL